MEKSGTRIQNWQKTKRQLEQNKTAIQEYNFRIIVLMSKCAVLVLLSILIMSFFPQIFVHSNDFRFLFAFTALFFLSLFMLCRYNGELVKRHSTFYIYMTFFATQIFCLILEVIITSHRHNQHCPYSLLLGYMLLQPIVIIDGELRAALWNIINTILCIIIAIIWKPAPIWVNDIINCFVFTLTGIGIGTFTRTYTISYIDIKRRELQQSMLAAKAANKAKSDFLAHMSHEIRTPLNVVLGQNEMILREAKDKNILDYAGDIKQAGKMLFSLINDILDFSKIEAGEFSLLQVEYSLDSVINDLVNIILPHTHEKGLDFSVKVAEDTPAVLFGDERRIKQCVMNLLTNAVKYTERGSITMQVSSFKEITDGEQYIQLTFSVTDTGIGIREEDLTRLFSPFERLEEDKHRNIEGTGLGLAIVQSILKKMDSGLYVQSEYGKGSEFSFTISQKVIKDVPIGKFNAKAHTADAPTQHQSFIAPNAKILVVDDLKMNLDVMCGLLKWTKIQIDTAISGAMAIQLVKAKRYDIVFIDHRMPVMDGIETLHAMQQLDENASANAIYIALTANAIRGSRNWYLREGFDDYLSKPIDYDILEKMLLKYLRSELVIRQDNRKQTGSERDPEQCKSCSKYNDCPMCMLSSVPQKETEANGFLLRYHEIEGIDHEAALAACGSADTLETAVRSFCTDCEKQRSAAEGGMQKKDWRNYTIAVHALKTALRLVGLTELSAEAAKLEKLGNSEDESTILAESPDFFLKLEDWKGQFETLLGMPQKFSAKQYQEAVLALTECAEAADLHSAENILTMIDGYQLADKDAETFHLLLQAARNGNTAFFQELVKDLGASEKPA